MSHFIHETYRDWTSAEAAVERLAQIGYGPDEVSVVTNSETRGGRAGEIDAHQVGNAATGGGVIGAAMGAILATTATGAAVATVATGGLAAPFVAGPLVAALAGAVGGSAIGALVGAAGSEEERQQLTKDLESGGVIVAVQARQDDDASVRRALDGGFAVTGAGVIEGDRRV